jgi:hypothetical protein
MADKECARISMSMMKDDFEELLLIAADRGKSLSQYLATVIAIKAYIDDAQKRGAHFVIETKSWRGAVQREIFFP